ncbi:peptidoglycan-binding protein [Larkinella sp. GY13]|uniref:peptidoglycan-binding protein n=1 Tax=Larkinella sp. GY13 TaxID=3453720 RepID=UPI003EED31C5
MQPLQLNSSGADVVRLQEKLKALGFNPGKIDGDFGTGTEAAVIAFQRSEGLLADGIVGLKTLRALGFEPTPEAVAADSVLPQVTVGVVSRMFPLTPLDNIKKNLPFVLDALKKQDLTDRNMVLMALSTIRAETAGFKPIDEGKSRFNTSPGGKPFDLYDNRRDLGNQGPPDGDRFKGRGFIQLTGRSNYQSIGRELGVDLIGNPALANKPDVAAAVLALFLKRKERQIKEALLENDLRQARKLVNGGSHGLAEFTAAFRIGESLLPVKPVQMVVSVI